MDYRLEKDYVNSLDILSFNGIIEEINDSRRLDEVVELLQVETLVGFDTESRPAFKRGESFPVSVIQIVTNSHAYLVRNLQVNMTEKFTEFICNPKIKKLGIALHDDIKKLREFIPNICADGFIDLSSIAKKKGIIQIGARALTARYLDGRLSKAMQTSNWAAKVLNEKQRRYAALDGWVCLHIYPKLLADTTDYHAMAEAIELAKSELEASLHPSQSKSE